MQIAARSAVEQIKGDHGGVELAEDSVLNLSDSEEKRSSEMFKVRESLPKERASFEDKHRDKYRDACEFFEFKGRFGRHPTVEDKGTVQLMGEELTRLAGRLYQEKALADGVLPKAVDVMKLAYKEFAQRSDMKKGLADRMAVEYNLSPASAQIMAHLIITQEDISGQKLKKDDEVKCLDLAKFAEVRMTEIIRENGAQNSVKNESSRQTPDTSPNLATYRLTRELTQMQAHQNRHGTLPSGDNLLKIQEQSRMETQKLSEKILMEQTAQLQRDRNIRQGMKM